MNRVIFPSLIGPIGIETDGEMVLRVFISPDWISDPVPCSVAMRTMEEMNRYFSGELQEFSVPLSIEGTSFRQKVLQALREIPYGTTLSYRSLAEKIGSPKAFRAVGSVCAGNDLPILIPCHRVVKSDGTPGNYAFGPELKARLLKMEKDKH